MSLLFTVEQKRVMPNTETLMMSPFKEIWERDKDKNKSTALREFSFIEFMVSVKRSNPYSGYPKKERRLKVLKDLFPEEEWEEDALVKLAMDKLETMQREASASYNYFKSALIAAEKMQDFFLNFDLVEDINPKTGAPLYKPRDITNAINDTAKVLQNLEELREKVDNEIYEETRNKGGRKISLMANPETL